MLILASTICRCAPESAVSTLDCEQWSNDAAQSLMWRSKPSQSRTWLRRWKREAWIQLLRSRTCTISHGESLLDWWTSYLAASRANHSATPESVKGWKIHATFGRPSLEVSGLFNQPVSSSRTSMESPAPSRRDITAFSTMSSATWKKWITEQRRDALRHRKLVHRICGSDGSSLGFATPTAKANQTAPSMQKHPGCRAIWATPTASKVTPNTTNPADITNQDGEPLQPGEKSHDRRTQKPVQTALTDQVRQWPTPRTITGGAESAERKQELGRTASGGGDLQAAAKNWPTPTGAEGSKIGNQPNYGQLGLSNHPEIVGEIQREKLTKSGRWPIETARDHKAFGVNGLADPDNPNTNGNRGGLLNPAWVETLMGFPIGWTDCVRLATLLSQQSQQEHSQNFGSGSRDG